MARDIQKRTNNGKMLVDFAMGILENKDRKYNVKDQRWAAEFLADRGMGKPIATVELEGMLDAPPLERKPKLDPASLTREQRALVREFMMKFNGIARPPRPVAVTPTDNVLMLIDGDRAADEDGGE